MTTRLPDLPYDQLTTAPWPANPSDEVVPGLSVGGLTIGDDSETFDRVLTLAPGLRVHRPREVVMDWKDHLQLPMTLEEAILVVFVWRTKGMSVLVRCEAGLNRSALVVARTLLDEGFTTEMAVQQIRLARSPWALCNPAYLEHLRSFK